jgi:hypothetical protein
MCGWLGHGESLLHLGVLSDIGDEDTGPLPLIGLIDRALHVTDDQFRRPKKSDMMQLLRDQCRIPEVTTEAVIGSELQRCAAMTEESE